MRLALENPQACWVGLPLAAVVLLWFAWSQWRQGTPTRQITVLTALRGAVLLALVLLASRPVWVAAEEQGPDRNQVVLLIDRSESMSLTQGQQSRYQQAVDLARDRILPDLQRAGFQVKPFLFAEDATPADGQQIARAAPNGSQTNLARAIVRGVTDAARAPLALIVLTDGVATNNAEDARAVTVLAENHVPFLGIGVGLEGGQRTLALDEVTAPRLAPPNQKFHVAARLTAVGEEEFPHFDLLLLRDGQFAQRRSVAGFSGARIWQESFEVQESAERVCHYTVQVALPTDPTLKCPATSAATDVRIVAEKELTVLFLQGGLTWDYKFIRLALAGDPTVRLAGLSRTSSESKFVQGADDTTDLTDGFPATLDRLLAFRVVVLSNLRPHDLNPAQQELLARFCGEGGGGLLMIGGAETFNASWHGSRLEQLLPVRFAPSPPANPNAAVRVQLTEAALGHPVFQISEAGENRNAWAALPTFSNCATIQGLKPGAEVWASGGENVAFGGRPAPQQPLIVTQHYGAGQATVIGMQNLWRWRLDRNSQPQHYDRFWQQLLRYLSGGGPPAVALTLADQALQVNAPIQLVLERRADPRRAASERENYRFQVKDERGQTLSDQNVELRLGQSTTVSFRAERPGSLTLSVLDARQIVLTSRTLEIRDVSRELEHTSRNMEALRHWASISSGSAVRFEDCRDSRDLLKDLTSRLARARPAAQSHLPAGINGWVLTVLVGCLCGEWSLRKRWRLR